MKISYFSAVNIRCFAFSRRDVKVVFQRAERKKIKINQITLKSRSENSLKVYNCADNQILSKKIYNSYGGNTEFRRYRSFSSTREDQHLNINICR